MQHEKKKAVTLHAAKQLPVDPSSTREKAARASSFAVSKVRGSVGMEGTPE